MPELETLLRDARPEWPEPSSAAEARARTALGIAPSARSPRSRLSRGAGRRGTRLLIPVALLVTAGAAVAATLISTSSSGAAAGRPASLDFGAPGTVGAPVDAFGGAPVAAVDGHGVVTVAWGRGGRIVASTRPPGGDWSEPVRLSDPAERAAYPAIGADRDGAVTVTWRARIAGRVVRQRFTLPSGAPAGELRDIRGQRWAVVARTRPAGEDWEPAVVISGETARVRDMEHPALVVTPQGRATVVWDAGPDVFARGRAPGGDWGATTRLGGGGGEAVDPQLSGASPGTAIAVWSNRLSAGLDRRYAIQAALMDPDGGWGAPAVLDDRSINPPNAAGAIGGPGDAVVARTAETDVTTTAAFVRPPGGDWSAAELIDRSQGLFGIRGRPAVDRSGRAVIVSGPRGAAQVHAPDGGWAPYPLPPVAGRALGLGALTDGSGAIVVLRLSGARLLLDAPGRSGSLVTGTSAGTPSVSTGTDGTSVAVWATFGAGARVVAAVAEGGR